jgi:hypothetical protein
MAKTQAQLEIGLANAENKLTVALRRKPQDFAEIRHLRQVVAAHKRHVTMGPPRLSLAGERAAQARQR